MWTTNTMVAYVSLSQGIDLLSSPPVSDATQSLLHLSTINWHDLVNPGKSPNRPAQSEFLTAPPQLNVLNFGSVKSVFNQPVPAFLLFVVLEGNLEGAEHGRLQPSHLKPARREAAARADHTYSEQPSSILRLSKLPWVLLSRSKTLMSTSLLSPARHFPYISFPCDLDEDIYLFATLLLL